MDHLQHTFIAEADELLADLEHILLKCDMDLNNKESVEAIFRVMHTLKGSAGMFGFIHIGELTHHLETIFDSIRETHALLSKEIIDLTLQSVDHLKNIIHDRELGRSTNAVRHHGLMSAIATILVEPVAGGDKKAGGKSDIISTYYIIFNLSAGIFKSGNNPLYLIDDVTALGQAVVIPDLSGIPPLSDLAPDCCYTNFELILATTSSPDKIKEVFLFAEDQCGITIEKLSQTDLLSDIRFKSSVLEHALKMSQIGLKRLKSWLKNETNKSDAIARPSNKRESQRSSIRVSSDKLDGLMNLISELVTAQARLTLLARQNNIPEFSNLSENMEKITKQLRDTAFNICLVPLQTLETRFQRLLRDLSRELKKEIDFITDGIETELDKSMIERISDPLLHILRNSVDHGIEASEERVKNGKKKNGTIILKAFHSGTGVYIQIKDDGRGIDTEKIKTQALSKGLITGDTILSEPQILGLVFTPGFSTAEKVTDVSGRGVGMDVVKRNIEAIQGEVKLESRPGEGTTITIRLPLTLSIIDGMRVKIGASEYILPLAAIDKCYEIKTEKLQPGLSQKLALDGHLFPVFNLREAFGEHTEKPKHTQVIKIHHDFPACITVDSVIGEYQAVMKPLTSLYGEKDDFSGATILGDGSVALVMDTAKLIKKLSEKVHATFQ
ncbi:MAG TPA: chemotaxis protein CheA [Chryseosolibacter sp.]|nr:chemotaxis protein CheA [Chryseosolibacter sp.]